ncbi:hypothetical protein LX73_1005 [Fodinibius salinus]|uniref:DUF3052 family protein n=1 Tax=Fodinibius salinus TaxID=860790 RepID=A0A5D3YIB9_9BACT|nr:hypothetical protein [Fodinibius salinus]TYP93305.1 hypothetical protein LX73_1005 [Fodinibius salinus]
MSSETVAENMNIESGMEIGFFHEPDDIMDLLGDLPDDVEFTDNLVGARVDILLAFIENRKTLEACLSLLKGSMKRDGTLWLAYEDGDENEDSELDQEYIINFASSLNLTAVGDVSFNDDWMAVQCERE